MECNSVQLMKISINIKRLHTETSKCQSKAWSMGGDTLGHLYIAPILRCHCCLIKGMDCHGHRILPPHCNWRHSTTECWIEGTHQSKNELKTQIMLFLQDTCLESVQDWESPILALFVHRALLLPSSNLMQIVNWPFLLPQCGNPYSHWGSCLFAPSPYHL